MTFHLDLKNNSVVNCSLVRGETQTKAEEVLKRKTNENITYEDVWDTCTGQKEFHSIRYFYQ